MNPNASEFVFNPSAAAWKPPSIASATQAPTPSPAPVPAPAAVTSTAAAPPPAPATVLAPQSSASEEEIDEDDPLWQATLKICGGDREAALRRLEDPDELMRHPEVVAAMESSDPVWRGDMAEPDTWEDADAALAGKMMQSADIAEKETGAGAAKPVDSSSTPSPSTAKAQAAKKAVVEEEGDVEEDEDDEAAVEVFDVREHMNLVFIGHVDAGKSTLSGSILYIMGKVDKRTIERFEKEAKDRNRESWFLAFIMDTSEEERAKGKTVEVGRAQFETETTRFTILDAPGHKNYVPNMISGAAQADVGVLVISARKGEFETGFEKGGQTREHALLARTLGVDHLVVVINKMDDPTVEWSLERYTECVSKLKPYLRQVGYVIKTDVKFVPISGLTGDNILREVDSARCPWWRDMYSKAEHNTPAPTLLATLDSLSISGRDKNGPLRVPCLDRYFERGCIVLGKVESGTLQQGQEIAIMPTRKKVKVDGVWVGETKVRSARPGENVLIRLNVPVEDIQKGYVLCLPQALCPAVTEIRAQMALVDMLEHRPIFTAGYEAVMHVHTVEIEVECVELLSVTERGKTVKRPLARTGQVCVARLRMPISTCMEPFERMPALGRITLRDEGKTIAIGKILGLYRPTAAGDSSGK